MKDGGRNKRGGEEEMKKGGVKDAARSKGDVGEC